ncbi:unnamed protein product [Absidia cylindrospora]
MEEDYKSILDEWLVSSERKISPSLLASTLLFVNKSPNGLPDLLPLLNHYWDALPTTTSTSTSNDTRVKCADLLAQTVTPSISTFTPTIVNELLQFVNGKLSEPLVVPRFVDIFLKLVKHDLCNTQHCITLCHLLFTHIPGKKWSQAVRFKVFSILGHLLQSHAKDINRSTSINFIEGFISIMDGEKDPRNLLLVFDLVRFMIDKLDISRHVEDLFDVVFCYFPISFTPPANDPLAITSEELKLGLRLCLAASPYFAYFATPLLIEKLLSSTGSAKKDTMDTIRLCAPAYGAHALLPHAQELFEALVKEVYQSSDISMESLALATIHQVVATLATGISIVNIRDPIEKAIEALLHQAVENLKEPELKNAKSASSILRAAASASDPACTLVVNAVIPLLYQEYKVTDPVSRQKAVLGILIDILEASNTLYGSIDSTGKDRDLQTPLTIYKQQLLQIFVASLVNENQPFDSQLRYQSLLGIRLMVIMKRFLSAQEIDITVAHLTRQALHTDRSIRNLVLSTLAIVSKRDSNALIRHTLPCLLDALEGSTTNNNYQDIFSAIKILTIEPKLFCALAEPLLSKLNIACRASDVASSNYSCALAECLYFTMAQIEITPEILHVGQTILFPTIITESVKSNLNLEPTCWKVNPTLLNTMALIVAIIVQKSNSSHQEQMLSNAFSLFVNGNDQVSENASYRLFGTCTTLSDTTSDDNQDQCKRDITLFFPAIIGNCRKEIRLPIPDINIFLQQLIQHAVNVNCDTRRMALSETAAVIVNKWINDDMVHFISQCISDQLEPLLCGQNITKKKMALEMLIWLTKGLVIRGHGLGFEFLNKMIDLCQHDDLGPNVAAGFAVILHQDGMILNRNAHSVVSILYRQRIFQHCIPRFLSNYNHLYCLVALSHILTNIPTQVPASEISKLMPPIIAALLVRQHDELTLSMINVAQSIVPWSSFHTITSTTTTTTATTRMSIHDYSLDTLLDALLELAIGHPRTIVRKNALHCLYNYACTARSTNKADVLQPYATTVIKKLGLALDDKKRLVRKEAVDCREQWYMLLTEKK